MVFLPRELHPSIHRARRRCALVYGVLNRFPHLRPWFWRCIDSGIDVISCWPLPAPPTPPTRPSFSTQPSLLSFVGAALKQIAEGLTTAVDIMFCAHPATCLQLQSAWRRIWSHQLVQPPGARLGPAMWSRHLICHLIQPPAWSCHALVPTTWPSIPSPWSSTWSHQLFTPLVPPPGPTTWSHHLGGVRVKRPRSWATSLDWFCRRGAGPAARGCKRRLLQPASLATACFYGALQRNSGST